jgi:ribosomal protein S18 acetylase RimI-like enzyme
MIRRGGRADVPFLKDMLRHAYYWRWGTPEAEEIPNSRYVEGFGAAWYRVFRHDAPGYGFVDEQTPELSIAVVPSRRGRGFGDELLRALMDRARLEGYTSLSLSVERENPALKLYERFGFRPVEERGDTLVMRADLHEHAVSG